MIPLHFPLTYLSVWPYFIVMLLLFVEAAVIQRYVPFFRRAFVQESQDINHLSQLDGLRGLLATGIFFTHAETFRVFWSEGRWNLPESNFYSQLAVAPVAMFFLITGFLFWAKAQKARKETALHFFWHRVRRLYPAYLAVVLLLFLIAAWVGGFHRNVSIYSLARSAVAYLSFQMIPGPPLNNYNDAPLIVANAFWSLRVEWMFYLIYPLLAVMARTAVRQGILVLIAASLYVGLPVIRGHIEHSGGGGTFGLGTLLYFNFYLCCYFSFGMLAAYLYKHFRLEKFLQTLPMTCLGLASLLLIVTVVRPVAGLLEGALIAIPFTLIVYGNKCFGLLSLAPLTLLGQVSYSTYLLHGMVLFVGGFLIAQHGRTPMMTPLEFWVYVACAGIVVVGLSAVSYRLLEAPLMKGYGTVKRPQG